MTDDSYAVWCLLFAVGQPAAVVFVNTEMPYARDVIVWTWGPSAVGCGRSLAAIQKSAITTILRFC